MEKKMKKKNQRQRQRQRHKKPKRQRPKDQKTKTPKDQKTKRRKEKKKKIIRKFEFRKKTIFQIFFIFNLRFVTFFFEIWYSYPMQQEYSSLRGPRREPTCIDARMDTVMDGWMGWWMDRWGDGWMDGRARVVEKNHVF